MTIIECQFKNQLVSVEPEPHQERAEDTMISTRSKILVALAKSREVALAREVKEPSKSCSKETIVEMKLPATSPINSTMEWIQMISRERASIKENQTLIKTSTTSTLTASLEEEEAQVKDN